jgi:hypothetical protein
VLQKSFNFVCELNFCALGLETALDANREVEKKTKLLLENLGYRAWERGSSIIV